jgi:RHS repeat-associated protein
MSCAQQALESPASIALRSFVRRGQAVRAIARWVRSHVAIVAAFSVLTAASGIAQAQSPDLQISNLSIGAIVANQNGSWNVPVSFTVTNVGTATAPNDIYDRCYVSTDGTLSNDDTYMNQVGRGTPLAAGASYPVSMTCQVPSTFAPGSYTIFAKADVNSTPTDTGRVVETDETNNVASAQVTVQRPDLAVSNMALGAVVANQNGTWNVPVSFTVTNLGPVPAQNDIYDQCWVSTDGTLSTNDTYMTQAGRGTPLAAGASYNVSLTCQVPASFGPGTHTIFVKVDADNGPLTTGRVVETDETNNVAGEPVTLIGYGTPTTTNLAVSANPIVAGQSATLTATVNAPGGNGNVTFKDGTTTLGVVPVASGSAALPFTFPNAGNRALTATYGNDSSYASSTSSTVTLVVNAAAATVTLVSSASTAYQNQTVLLTATVTGAAPTGAVTFMDGATPLGSATVTNGKAWGTTAFTTAGTRSVTAAYGGDANNGAMTSAGVSIQILAGPSLPTSTAPVVNYEYDAQGNLTKVTQAPGVSGFNFATQSAYDRLERRTSTTDAKSGVTGFQYNGREDLTRVTDPRNLATQYPRNGLGDATQLISPDTGTANHTYDAAGKLLTRTDSRSVLATYSYDALNRVTSVAYSKSGSTSRTYGYTYDQTGAGFANGIGRLTSSAFPEGSGQYVYDTQGRLTSSIQRVNAQSGANSAQRTHTVGYAYDAAGNVTSLTYPSGRAVEASYANGQLSALSLKASTGAAAVPMLSAVQWEPFGAVRGWNWHLNSGTQAHLRVFDGSGRMVRYRLGASLRDLSYDAAGRITAYNHYDAATAAAQASLDQGFGYDELGRITSIAAGGATWAIAYDATGNRTSVTQSGATRAYTTAATRNRLTALTNPAQSFTHDAAGNTLTGPSAGITYTATYNLESRLRTMKVGTPTTTYIHDAMGQRVRKHTSTGAATTVIFAYDQQGHLLGEYDNTGAAIREYVWLGDEPVAVFTPNGTNPPNVLYVHTDHLGAPRVVMDKGGQLRWRWMAEPFGTTAPENNPAGLGAFTFNLRMPGQYADSETGLFYNYFRDYDAGVGRYTQSDPIGLAGGINTYSYVGGNPVSFSDFLGLVASAQRCIENALDQGYRLDRTVTTEEILARIFVPGIWPDGVGAGPDLDPRHPRRPPLAPEINFRLVWDEWQRILRSEYRITELVQLIIRICRWSERDRCGIEYERSSVDEFERVISNRTLISQDIFWRRIRTQSAPVGR